MPAGMVTWGLLSHNVQPFCCCCDCHSRYCANRCIGGMVASRDACSALSMTGWGRCFWTGG